MVALFDLVDDWGPEKVVAVSDSRLGYQGVLVIDNTARGMGKGGTRMQPTVDVEEIARLARVMTWKWAAVDLFYGGAKAGIRADPERSDKERVLRSFVRKLADHVPDQYVFGLDMGLTESDAAIINDELGTRGAAVGTPAEVGGIPYDQLGVTGYGVGEVVDVAAAERGLRGGSVAIQGFGAVGRATAERLDALGYSIFAVSTAHGAVVDMTGLDVADLVVRCTEFGDRFVTHHPQGGHAAGTELFTAAEILVPAAVQHVIGADEADRVHARLIVEAANLPVSVQAQQMFHAHGVTVVPDFIANAGGVISAAYAMEARYSAFRVDPARIFENISSTLRANAETCLQEADLRGTTPHEAARAVAQERVAAAMRARSGGLIA